MNLSDSDCFAFRKPKKLFSFQFHCLKFQLCVHMKAINECMKGGEESYPDTTFGGRAGDVSVSSVIFIPYYN